jgi:chromosome segregation ATPase
LLLLILVEIIFVLDLCYSQVESLEKRLQSAEGREARLMADLREGEAVAAERDELAAAVAALKERVEESRAERGQLEQYKKVSGESPGGLEGGGMSIDTWLLF